MRDKGIIEKIEKLLQEHGLLASRPVGQPMAHRRRPGQTIDVRYLCDVPAGVDPRGFGDAFNAALGLPRTTSTWKATKAPRVLVLRCQCGRISPVPPSSLKEIERALPIATTVNEHRIRRSSTSGQQYRGTSPTSPVHSW